MSAVATPEEVDRFGALVARVYGLRVSDEPGRSLARLLGRRAERYGGSVPRYLDRLDADPSGTELGRLAPELTVPETYFFRDADQLRVFAEVVLPDRARATVAGVRVLSAGCATGEEPYSLAILAREAGYPADITGVDVNPVALGQAREGRYSTWSLRATPAEVRRRWFHADREGHVLDAGIRACARFALANLAAPDEPVLSPDRYDVIFCRNVLMYFTEPGARTLLRRLAAALVPGGFLFLGHAETARAGGTELLPRRSAGCFYYQRPPVPEQVRPPVVPARTPVRTGAAPVPASATVAAVATVAARRPVTLAPAGPTAPPDPDTGPALRLLRAERFTEALAALPPSNRPDVLLLKAVLLTATGDFHRARAESGRLLDRDWANPDAHYALAACLDGTGDPDGAAESCRRASGLDQAFAMPKLHLGLLAVRAGDHPRARRELAGALDALPHEDARRIDLFGGGFSRDGLVALCRSRLAATAAACATTDGALR